MSSSESVRLPSAGGAATAPQPAPTEEARLLGDARGRAGVVAGRKSAWRYLRRFATGEYVSYRVLTSIAFMAMGAVALVLNVTVERVAQAPVSMNWLQSLAGQADPHLAAHLAAARTETAPLEVLHPRRLGGRLHAELEEEEREIAMRRQLERERFRTRTAAALGVTPETGSEAASSADAASQPEGISNTEANVSSGEEKTSPTESPTASEREGQTFAGGLGFPAVALAAASRVRADDARCDLRPHLGPSRGDVFKCDAAMFQEARDAASAPDGADASAFSPAHSPAGVPAWPQQESLTRNAARASALRSSVNACRRDSRVDFASGEKDRPYALPAEGVSTAEKSGDPDEDAFGSVGAGSAYVYAFLHVHKCAGTFVDYKLRLAAEKVRARVRANAGRVPLPPQRHASLFPNFPLMELSTPETRRFMAWTFANARPKRADGTSDGTSGTSERDPFNATVTATEIAKDETATSSSSVAFGDYGAAALRRRYDAGERLFVKSSEAMGFCDYVDAPCAYLTVLREPLERFLSYYAYICLLGAEHREHWTPEWLEEGRCTADPAEFARVVSPSGFSMVDLLAPGGDATGRSGCRLAAAKRNLVSGCTRYLLLDRLDEGLERLARDAPDLRAFAGAGGGEGREALPSGAEAAGAAGLGETVSLAAQNSVNGKNSARDALSDAQRALLAQYEADETIMAELREYLREDTEVYDFAVARYDEQWDKPLATC